MKKAPSFFSLHGLFAKEDQTIVTTEDRDTEDHGFDKSGGGT